MLSVFPTLDREAWSHDAWRGERAIHRRIEDKAAAWQLERRRALSPRFIGEAYSFAVGRDPETFFEAQRVGESRASVLQEFPIRVQNTPRRITRGEGQPAVRQRPESPDCILRAVEILPGTAAGVGPAADRTHSVLVKVPGGIEESPVPRPRHRGQV